MSIILKHITAGSVTQINGAPQVQCECCNHIEQPKHIIASCDEWLHAANRVGWRSIQTEQYSHNCICPICVDYYCSPAAREAV